MYAYSLTLCLAKVYKQREVFVLLFISLMVFADTSDMMSVTSPYAFLVSITKHITADFGGLIGNKNFCNMKLCRRIVSAAALLALVACNSKEVTYIPFQETGNGFWGVVDSKGKVLFSEELEGQIVGISDGMIRTQDEQGLFQYSTLEKHPKSVGGEYKYAGNFYNGVAPVTEKAEGIKVINKKGKVKFELQQIEGKQVEWLSDFRFGGMAMYLLEDETRGLVNTKGKVVTPPQAIYSITPSPSGDLLFVSFKDEALVLRIEDFIAGKKNRALHRVDMSQPVSVGFGQAEGYYWVTTAKSHMIKKGSKVVSTIARNSKNSTIEGMVGKYIIFSNESGDRKGLMDVKGNVVIRPKYTYLAFLGEKTLVCSTNGENYKVIDVKDNVKNDRVITGAGVDDALMNEALSYVINSPYTTNTGLSVNVVDGVVVYHDGQTPIVFFTDDKGKTVGHVKSVVTMNPHELSGWSGAWSDFLNVRKLIRSLNVTKDGVAGVEMTMKPAEFITKMIDRSVEYDEYDEFNYILSKNAYSDNLSFEQWRGGMQLGFTALLDSPVATLKSMRKYYGYEYNEPVFNENCRLRGLRVTISYGHNSQCVAQSDMIFKGFCDHFAAQCDRKKIGAAQAEFTLYKLKESGVRHLQIEHFRDRGCVVLTYGTR